MRSLSYHKCVCVLTQACSHLHHRVVPPHSDVVLSKVLTIQTRPLSETVHRRLYTVTCSGLALFVVTACTVVVVCVNISNKDVRDVTSSGYVDSL